MRDFENLHLDSVDSTNTYAKTHFADLADGTLVTADFQTAGRGRLGRKWVAPRGVNLCGSFVMKKTSDAFRATAAVSLAVLDLLREAAPAQDFFIKWPNDVYAGDAKIAGILCEGVFEGGRIAGVVAGMGINVNLADAELAEIDRAATSLLFLEKRSFDLKKMRFRLAKLLKECYILYSRFPARLFERWKSENRLLGRPIEFDTPEGTRIEGFLTDIQDDGAIRVSVGTENCIFRCGDLRITRKTLLNLNSKHAGLTREPEG